MRSGGSTFSMSEVTTEAEVAVEPPAAEAQVAVDELAVPLGEAPVGVRSHGRTRGQHVARQQAGHDLAKTLLLRGLELRILDDEVHSRQRRRSRRTRTPRGKP